MSVEKRRQREKGLRKVHWIEKRKNDDIWRKIQQTNIQCGVKGNLVTTEGNSGFIYAAICLMLQLLNR